MKVVELIATHKDELLGKWARKVVDRLGLQSTELVQLINELPDFLDEVVEYLDKPPDTWRRSGGAEAHGEHRIETGLDIGALAEEFGMVAEAIFELIGEYELVVTPEESDPQGGLISTTSPVGKSLMGKEEGDEVVVRTPAGARNFEIRRLMTIHDQAENA